MYAEGRSEGSGGRGGREASYGGRGVECLYRWLAEILIGYIYSV